MKVIYEIINRLDLRIGTYRTEFRNNKHENTNELSFWTSSGFDVGEIVNTFLNLVKIKSIDKLKNIIMLK